MGPNGVNLADWDHLSKGARLGFVLQAVAAVAMVPFGLYIGIGRHGAVGWLMGLFSVAWIAYQCYGCRQLLDYRRAGG